MILAKSDFKGQETRQKIIQLIRKYFLENKFVEVEVPIILPKLPLEPNLYSMETKWKFRDKSFYLITSPESSLKKIIAKKPANYFCISKVFRDLEDIGPSHNLEFSMLEWYEMEKSYKDIADTTEKLITFINRHLNRNQKLKYQGKKIDLTSPWEKISMKDMFLQYAGMKLEENLTREEIFKTAKQKGYTVDETTEWEPIFNQIFINEVEPKLPKNRPIIIFDFPSLISPLCRKCANGPGFSERFEFYIGGMELGNGYGEERGSEKLKKAFRDEEKFREENKLPKHEIDFEFADACEKMPECAGIGVGIERLAMLFCDTTKIEDVLYFPTNQF